MGKGYTKKMTGICLDEFDDIKMDLVDRAISGEFSVVHQRFQGAFLDVALLKKVRRACDEAGIHYYQQDEQWAGYSAPWGALVLVDGISEPTSKVFRFVGIEGQIPEFLLEFAKICQTLEDKAEREEDALQGSPVYVLQAGRKGLQAARLGRITQARCRENYSEKVNEQTDTMVREFQNPNPPGRLVIMDGPPGTGKTSIVKAMMHEIEDALILYVPPNMVASLDQPGILGVFTGLRNSMGDEKPIIIVCEDAEQLLLDRTMTGANLVSTLLNVTDGILGSALDIKVVATVNNLKEARLDPATVRTGRLLEYIRVPELDADHATQVIRRLTGNNKLLYTESATLANLYGFARQARES